MLYTIHCFSGKSFAPLLQSKRPCAWTKMIKEVSAELWSLKCFPSWNRLEHLQCIQTWSKTACKGQVILQGHFIQGTGNVFCWRNLNPVASIVCLVSSHSLEMQSTFHLSVLFILVGKSLSTEVFFQGYNLIKTLSSMSKDWISTQCYWNCNSVTETE